MNPLAAAHLLSAASRCPPPLQRLCQDGQVHRVMHRSIIFGTCLSLAMSNMPAENFPHLISKESFLGRFSYFLPNFCISALAIFASVSYLWLPETLHTHHRKGKGDGPTEGSEGRNSSSFRSLLTNWPLMSSIIVYCVFSIHDMAYSEIIPLWAVSDRKHGGLRFTSRDIGIVLGISGTRIFSVLLD